MKIKTGIRPPLPYPAEDLVARAVQFVRAWEPGTPRWSAVGRVFSMGSGYSIQLCEHFGLDPHEVKPWDENEDEVTR